MKLMKHHQSAFARINTVYRIHLEKLMVVVSSIINTIYELAADEPDVRAQKYSLKITIMSRHIYSGTRLYLYEQVERYPPAVSRTADENR